MHAPQPMGFAPGWAPPVDFVRSMPRSTSPVKSTGKRRSTSALHVPFGVMTLLGLIGATGAAPRPPSPPDAQWQALVAAAPIIAADNRIDLLACRRTNLDPERCSASNQLYFLDSSKVTTWKALLNVAAEPNCPSLIAHGPFDLVYGLHGAVLFYDRAHARAAGGVSDARCKP